MRMLEQCAATAQSWPLMVMGPTLGFIFQASFLHEVPTERRSIGQVW
jgi:hypothetical protein